VVVDPLFQQYYDENKPLGAFVGSYDVTPDEHLAVQSTIQKYVDSCISKTINLPSDFDASQLADDMMNYLPYMKGCTVYKAGSKGMEPLQHIPLTKENVDKYMNQAATAEVQTGEACSLEGGDCGE